MIYDMKWTECSHGNKRLRQISLYMYTIIIKHTIPKIPSGPRMTDVWYNTIPWSYKRTSRGTLICDVVCCHGNGLHGWYVRGKGVYMFCIGFHGSIMCMINVLKSMLSSTMYMSYIMYTKTGFRPPLPSPIFRCIIGILIFMGSDHAQTNTRNYI